MLKTIPGVGAWTAQTIIAEIGVDMTRFPTAGYLASYLDCPGTTSQPGSPNPAELTKATQRYEPLCARPPGLPGLRTKHTYLAAQFRRFRRRFGKRGDTKAVFAVAHTMLVIVWHILANNVEYNELGENYLNTRNDAEQRAH